MPLPPENLIANNYMVVKELRNAPPPTQPAHSPTQSEATRSGKTIDRRYAPQGQKRKLWYDFCLKS